MNIVISVEKSTSGNLAARKGAAFIREAIAGKGHASIIVATGMSQFEMLEALVQEDVDWSKVEAFHLDEYIGIPDTHPASFRKYLRERFVQKIPNLRRFHYIAGDAKDIRAELERLGALVGAESIDVAFVGVGENGHLAFNDPPADFMTEEAYLVVDLDLACRRQQLGEGWFSSLEAVPLQAVSMGIRQIMKSRHIINTVPDARKAKAVREALTGPVTKLCPSSILQNHPSCWWYLDTASASLLPKGLKAK